MDYTFEANSALSFEDDLRSYDTVKVICEHFNVVLLITNNPLKIKSLERMGISVNKVINTKTLHKYT